VPEAQLIIGAPVLRAAAATIDYELEEVLERHSHAFVLGRFVGICNGNGGSLALVAVGVLQLPGSAIGKSLRDSPQ